MPGICTTAIPVINLYSAVERMPMAHLQLPNTGKDFSL